MDLPRILDLAAVVRDKSCFLFGPRQTGKTSLLRHLFPDAPRYDLLQSDTFLRLNIAPERLREELQEVGGLAVIDEIQRLPQLLNEVHWLIEERKMRFLLTGSSARKLRHGGVNLLGGRARSRTLHPFVSAELGVPALEEVLYRGTLPPIHTSTAVDEDLAAYCGDYLQHEIAAEGLTRNVPAFSRFLEVAAASNGQLINYTKMSNDAQVPRATVTEYFQILKDTLIAHELPAWRQTSKRKPIGTSKLYFFDVGVARFLRKQGRIRSGSPEFGALFEHLIFHELRAFIDYLQPQLPLSYWRSTSGFEVDFVLGDGIGIEVKATKNVSAQDLRGLLALLEEKKAKRGLIVSQETRRRRVGVIDIIPWREFLRSLWASEF